MLGTLTAQPAYILALGPIIAPYVIYRALVLPRFPGRNAFIALFIAGVWWIGAAAAEMMVVAPQDKIFCAQIAWLGIMTAPPFWFLFVWSYVRSGRDRPPVGWTVGMAAAALAMVVVVFTPSLRHLVYVSATPSGPQPGAPIDYVHGPVFYLATGYIYVCLGASAVLIAQAAIRGAGVYRRHYLAFQGAILAPWLLNFARQFGAVSVEGFDPTPFCLLISGLIFFWLIARERLFMLTPIARGKVLEAVSDPILVLNEQGLVVEMNPTAARMPGLAGGLGRELPPAWADALGPCLAAAPGQAPDIRMGEQDFEARRTPLTYYGREVGQMLLLRDITRRKAMEDELRAAKAEADQALAAQKLMMREQRNFISMVGHEFRNPLSIIASAGQLLDMGGGAADAGPELAKIRRAVTRMTQLIEACLADDRLDSAALLYRPAVADLSALVEQDCADAALRAEGRTIRFTGEGAVEAMCDRTTLSVAVANLLDNALKYSPAEAPVEVTVQARGQAALIEVADRGPGVAPAERQAVFEKFYRAVGAEQAAGAGLGLYLVHRIVALHQGAVRILDREGGGALFRIELPLRRSAAA